MSVRRRMVFVEAGIVDEGVGGFGRSEVSTVLAVSVIWES